MYDDNKLFSTKDTALAAYLRTEGFELVKIDTANFPSVFYFENNNPKLNDFVLKFQAGSAEANVVIFFRNYRLLLSEIKDVQRREARRH